MRAHEIVIHRVEQDLVSGRIRVGDRLPSERALADELGVGRSSVREAMRVLEAMGVIRTLRGSGPDAGATVIADPATSIGSALRLHVATRFLPVGDVVETRVLLETWALRQATGSDVDLQNIDAQLDAMDDLDLTPEQFHAMDEHLHVTMSALAGNVLVEAMLGSLRDCIRGYMLDAVPLLENWPAVAVNLRSEHRGIVRALRSGDGDLAANLVRKHIVGFQALTSTPAERNG